MMHIANTYDTLRFVDILMCEMNIISRVRVVHRVCAREHEIIIAHSFILPHIIFVYFLPLNKQVNNLQTINALAHRCKRLMFFSS